MSQFVHVTYFTPSCCCRTVAALFYFGHQSCQFFICWCSHVHIKFCQFWDYIWFHATILYNTCNMFRGAIVFCVKISTHEKCQFGCRHYTTEPVHKISNNVGCATSKASDQSAHTRSLIRAFASRLSIL